MQYLQYSQCGLSKTEHSSTVTSLKADSILSMLNIIMNILEKKKWKNAGGRKLNRFRCYKANLSKGMTFPRVCLLSLSMSAW